MWFLRRVTDWTVTDRLDSAAAATAGLMFTADDRTILSADARATHVRLLIPHFDEKYTGFVDASLA